MLDTIAIFILILVVAAFLFDMSIRLKANFVFPMQAGLWFAAVLSAIAWAVWRMLL